MALPQAERQLILLSAGTAVNRHAMREYADQIGADVDWSRLSKTLRLRKLLPTLGPRILELSKGHANDDFVEAVEQAIDAGRRQSIFLQLVCLRIVKALADAGIPSTPLKGPQLGEDIYGDPGRRLSNDIDLLVAREQLHTAVEVVRGLGYDAPTDHVGHNGLPLLHYALVHERAELPPVELHWRIHWYEQNFARERLLPPADDQATDWRPVRVDELAALLLFYARDGFADLRLAADLGAWWDAHGAELPPAALDELLVAYPALARAMVVASEVAENLVGLPAERIIGEVPGLGFRSRIARRLANPNPQSSQSQVYADMGLVDGLLTPPGGFSAFVRRQVFLPREVLDERARISKRRAHSPLGRGMGVLARYALTMARLVRAPERLP